ncbi:MAG: DUF1810 family protein [Gemmataceae bacterium]
MNSIKGRPASITIFLADGLPDGLRTVEKAGWTGHAVVCPRSRFPEVKTNLEFARTGVYVLCGPSEEGDLPTVYIGEGDPTRPRLEQHYRQKDFWTSLMVFTSTGGNLNKAHVQYLESRLVSLARAAKRCVLDNSNDPQLPTLSTPDRAVMEVFLEEMLLIYPLLGLTVFEVPSQPKPVKGKASPGTKPGPPETALYLKARGIKASGYDRGEGFVVLAGSEAVGDKQCLESIPPSALEVRNGLVKQGVLVTDADHFKFTQGYSLNSPSQAAAVVMGCSASGLKEWKDAQGRPLKAIRVALPDELPNTNKGKRDPRDLFRDNQPRLLPDEPPDTNKGKPIKTPGVPSLPMPQARVLQALLPVDGVKPSMSRAELCKKVGYTETSGTITRALNGIREGGGSGTPHKGLLDSGLVTEAKRDEDNEAAYQITNEGIKAIEDYLKEHGELPKPRDKTLSTNIRYQKDQRGSTDMADANNTNIVDDPHDLHRFVQAQAQASVYDRALAEIRNGDKRTHWMWYIFPQHEGLGVSPTAKYYGIKSIEEARAYLAHPVLGPRLRECAEAAGGVEGRSARAIFGSTDEKKLKSCATLFACVSPAGSVFHQLLDKYYQSERDSKTLRLLGIASDVK